LIVKYTKKVIVNEDENMIRKKVGIDNWPTDVHELLSPEEDDVEIGTYMYFQINCFNSNFANPVSILMLYRRVADCTGSANEGGSPL